MQIITTVTQKGQITLPKKMRDLFGIDKYDKVMLEADQHSLRVIPAKDILDLAGTMKPKTKKSVLKARASMEKKYRRF